MGDPLADHRKRPGIRLSGLSFGARTRVSDPHLGVRAEGVLDCRRQRAERTIHEYATTDPWRTSFQLLSETLLTSKHTDESWTDDVAEAIAYARAITAIALTYQDKDSSTLSRHHQQRHDDLTDTVTTIGTGRGPVNADLSALAKGPVALYREFDPRPSVLTLLLDGDA